ncbi:MAG: DUF11 domain-containing protein [Candidatus Eremiobacteraeota bacterium]|nr:DUF11 domain-containing protein [Candidatus Eremiobacteraeota bacterium]
MAAVLIIVTVARSAGSVGVNKAFSPSNVAFATDSTLTITLLNSDPTTSVNVTTITDNLPAGLTIDSSVTPATTCAGGAVSTTAGSVTLTGGVIPQAPDQFNPGTCTITVAVFGSAAQNYQNTIPAGALQTSAGTNGTPASATLQVTNPGNVGVAIAVSPTVVPETASPVFTVTLTNPNSLALTNVTIPGTLTSPSGGATLHIVSVVSSCGGSATFNNAVSPPTFSVTGATIPANGSCTVTVTVSVNGQFSNNVRTQQLAIAAQAVTSAQGVTNNTGAAATVTYDPITPTIVKSFSPNPTVPGATITLTLATTNRDTVALTNFGFTDVLPGGLTLGAPPNLANSCAGPAGTISGTTTVVVSGLTLPAAPSLGSSTACTITFSVLVPASPPSQTPTNTINGSSVTNDQGLKSNNNTSVVLTVGPTPAPTPGFSKAFSPATVARANNSTLSINIINRAGLPAMSNVSFTDTLPAGLIIAAAPTANANCGAPTLTGAIGGTVITMTGGTIAAGARTCTVSVLVTPTVGPPLPVTLTNSIPAGGITATQGGNPVSNPEAVNANLTVGHGLTVTHYFSPSGGTTVGVAPIKGIITVTDRITSTAGNDDANLSAVFSLNTAGTNVTLAASPNFNYSCTLGSVLAFTPGAGGLTYTATSADYKSKDVCTITYNVTSTVAGTYTAGHTVISSTQDNSQTISGINNVVFVAPSQINVNKTFTPNTIPAAGVSHLQITLSNNANAVNGIVFNETGVAVTDNLPAGMTINSPPNASTTCLNGTLVAPAGGSTIQLTGATLPSRTTGGALQPCTITVDVTASVPGNLTNTIPADSITSDSGATNPFGTSVTLTSSANIGLVKTFLATNLMPGGVTWVSLVFTNGSNISETVNSLTDNLPSGIVVKDTTTQPPPQPGAPPNCNATVSGVAGGSSFTVTNFTIAPAAKCVTYVAVTTPTPTQFGTFTNTIPAGAIVTSSGLTNLQSTFATITVATVSLSLSKVVRNVTQGGSNGTSGTALPGDTLLYTITYTNTSPFNELTVAIKDTVPTNTTFVSATCGSLGTGLTACTPSGPTAGVVTWTMTGTLSPGGTGTVFLTVTVQ